MAKYYFGSEKEAVEKYAGKFTRRTATDSLFNLKLNFASDLCLAQQCSIKRPSDCLLDVMQYISILQVYVQQFENQSYRNKKQHVWHKDRLVIH